MVETNLDITKSEGLELSNLKLSDIGERRIIDEILFPRYSFESLPRFGDDTAFLAMGTDVQNDILVATTDPCPLPMASLLGFKDYYYWGWLLATINLSDLAAAGARPLAFLSSLILPNHMRVFDLLRLLDGIDACCRLFSTRVVGGNLKEAPQINLSGTAIGTCKDKKCMSRIGCHSGDNIIIIGDIGLFWAGVLSIQKRIPVSTEHKENLLRNILTPKPKLEIGQQLASRSLLTSCIDNSDGLYPSLVQLANANNLQMYIKADRLQFSEEILYVSAQLAIDPVRLVLGWGDWQLIGCVKPDNLNVVRDLGRQLHVPVHVIGQVTTGEGVMLEYQNHTGPLTPLDSQRFTTDSWFTSGIEKYINSMLAGSLWEND